MTDDDNTQKTEITAVLSNAEDETTTKKIAARGETRCITGASYQPPAARALTYVSTAINNPYLREQVINLMPQIFTGHPTVIVTKDGKDEPLSRLSKQMAKLYDRLDVYASMRMTFLDTLYYGASVKSVGYAKEGADITITEIRDLPACTFGVAAYTPQQIDVRSPNPLMPGIGVARNGELVVVQTDPFTQGQTRLTNVDVIIQPGAPYPAGEAYCMPIYPVIAELDVVTEALNSKVNRIGQPLIMPKISEEFSEDIEELNGWITEFFRYWGNKSGFLIPRGIEFVKPEIYESTGGEERLKCLTDLLAKFFNPTTTLDKDGQSVLSTTDTGRTAIWHAYITSMQEWIEAVYEEFFDRILRYNGYDDYKVSITLPRPSVDKSAIKLQQLQVAINAGLVTKAEARERLDTLELPPLTPEIEEELIGSRSTTNDDQYGGFGGGFGLASIRGAADDRTDATADKDMRAMANVTEPDDLPKEDTDPKTARAALKSDSRQLEAAMKDISKQVQVAIAKILAGEPKEEPTTEERDTT